MTAAARTDGARLARQWRDPLARAGIAARGVLYLVLGVLAIQFASGDVSSDQVSQAGAFEKVAEQPLGKFLLVVLTAGLAAMTLWRLVQTFVGDPIEGEDASDRGEFFVKAVIYGFLTFTAAKITADNWSGSGGSETAAQQAGDSQQQQTSSKLFDLPAGRWLVIGLGVVLIGIAVYQAWKYAVQAEFMERIAPPHRLSTPIEGFGRFGYAARSVVLTISGIFFVVAGVQYDPNESKGISGSLQELAEHDWGRILLWATAVGLFLFGLFCLAESRYRRPT